MVDARSQSASHRSQARRAFATLAATVCIALLATGAAATPAPVPSPSATPTPAPTTTPPLPETVPTPSGSLPPESSTPPSPPAPSPEPPQPHEPDEADRVDEGASEPHGDGPTEPLTAEIPWERPQSMSRSAAPLSPGPRPAFALPFINGARWGASGSHADSDGVHRGAIDFAPLSASDKNVRAVAAGRVYKVTCSGGYFLGVDHGGGWKSEYYHLTNQRSSLIGSWVESGTPLGIAGQSLPCGGTPGNHKHVHLSILNTYLDVPSGRPYVPAHGMTFGGYTQYDVSRAYNGDWKKSGSTVLRARGVTCCLTAPKATTQTTTSPLARDGNANGIDDESEVVAWNTDVTGDGLPDVVAFGAARSYSESNAGNAFVADISPLPAFSPAHGVSATSHPRYVIDVNGDDRADIVTFASNGVYVARSLGRAFSAPELWSTDFDTNNGWSMGQDSRTLADVNGDGLPDIVGFGSRTFVALNSGNGFGNARVWHKSFSSTTGWRNDLNIRTSVDLNGDDRADIVGFGAAGVWVALSTGSSFGAERLWVRDFGTASSWTRAQHHRALTDVNSDGLPDIVGFGKQGVRSALNMGSSFASSRLASPSFGSASGWRTKEHPRAVVDVTGDAKPDVVGIGAAGVYVSVGRGDGTFGTESRWSSNFGSKAWPAGTQPRSFADVDGDGRADVVGFGVDGIYVALSDGARFGAAARWSADFGDASGWRVENHPRAVAG